MSSVYFPAGSRATWTGDWNTVGFFNSPVTQIHEVSSYLEANAHMAIESSSTTEPSVFSTASDRTVTLKVRTLIDRNDVMDIDADIRHAFYVVMNQEPDASSIPIYTLAQNGSTANQTQQGTGAPNAADENAPPDTSGDNSDSGLTGWWNQFTGKLQAGSIGFVVGGLAVVGLLLVIAVKSEA
jgi:hypothetical protein